MQRRVVTSIFEQSRGRRHSGEEGGALVFVLIISAALLFVAGASLQMGVDSSRIVSRQTQGKLAFFCAETALDRGRTVVAANQAEWDQVLGGSGIAWHPVIGACPAPTGQTAPNPYTYSVTMRDNADDANQGSDSDGVVIIDAQVLQAGVPVARISGFVQTGSVNRGGDYSGQIGTGAQNTFNQSPN